MSGVMMMIIAIVVLGGAYLLYGRYLQNKWGIDPNAKTPAYEMEDGVDYVPADTNVVFGHQFASIAGAGGINGGSRRQFLAGFRYALDFNRRRIFRRRSGFLHPCMRLSKIKGRTIGYIIEEYIGKLGKEIIPFILLAVLYSGCCSVCRRCSGNI